MAYSEIEKERESGRERERGRLKEIGNYELWQCPKHKNNGKWGREWQKNGIVACNSSTGKWNCNCNCNYNCVARSMKIDGIDMRA